MISGGDGMSDSGPPTVSVQIVTFNSASDVSACLQSLAGQQFGRFRIRILDNGSTDHTLDLLRDVDADLVECGTNLGFAVAHNRLARSYPAPYILFLNPDTILEPSFLGELVSAMDEAPEAGSATGKLLRFDGKTLDSTGIVMTRNQRHLDRGAGEIDRGQYDLQEAVFGPSCAAALYRYACLEDVALGGQFFDEDFFAYREDADLAWRCQLMGWRSLYVPSARALHRRHVTPERRSSLSAEINRHSVKNRFLIRINNMTARHYRRDFWAITRRDLAVIGYVLLREWTSIPALRYIISSRRRLWRKREMIHARVRNDPTGVEKWFV